VVKLHGKRRLPNTWERDAPVATRQVHRDAEEIWKRGALLGVTD